MRAQPRQMRRSIRRLGDGGALARGRRQARRRRAVGSACGRCSSVVYARTHVSLLWAAAAHARARAAAHARAAPRHAAGAGCGGGAEPAEQRRDARTRLSCERGCLPAAPVACTTCAVAASCPSRPLAPPQATLRVVRSARLQSSAAVNRPTGSATCQARSVQQARAPPTAACTRPSVWVQCLPRRCRAPAGRMRAVPCICPRCVGSSVAARLSRAREAAAWRARRRAQRRQGHAAECSRRLARRSAAVQRAA